MAKPKVLVIEDDRALAEVLSYNLQANGYEVLMATDGQDMRCIEVWVPHSTVDAELQRAAADGMFTRETLAEAARGGKPRRTRTGKTAAEREQAATA